MGHKLSSIGVACTLPRGLDVQNAARASIQGRWGYNSAGSEASLAGLVRVLRFTLATSCCRAAHWLSRAAAPKPRLSMPQRRLQRRPQPRHRHASSAAGASGRGLQHRARGSVDQEGFATETMLCTEASAPALQDCRVCSKPAPSVTRQQARQQCAIIMSMHRLPDSATELGEVSNMIDIDLVWPAANMSLARSRDKACAAGKRLVHKRGRTAPQHQKWVPQRITCLR